MSKLSSNLETEKMSKMRKWRSFSFFFLCVAVFEVGLGKVISLGLDGQWVFCQG
jgi:hypothetical protein